MARSQSLMAPASFPPPFHTGHKAAGGALLWCWDQIGRRALPSAKSQTSVPPVQQLAKMIILSNSFFFFLLPSRRMGSASKPHTFLAKTIKEIAEVSQVELNPWEVFPL